MGPGCGDPCGALCLLPCVCCPVTTAHLHHQLGKALSKRQCCVSIPPGSFHDYVCKMAPWDPSRVDARPHVGRSRQHWPLVQDQPRKGRGQEWGPFRLGPRARGLGGFFFCLLNDKGLTWQAIGNPKYHKRGKVAEWLRAALWECRWAQRRGGLLSEQSRSRFSKAFSPSSPLSGPRAEAGNGSQIQNWAHG